MSLGTISPEMTLDEAIEFYLIWRTAPVALGRVRLKFISPRTLKDYGQKGKALRKFLGTTRLGDITLEDLRGFQAARLNADGFTRFYGKREVASPAGAIKINSELALLKKLMKMAMCWSPELEMYYLPFQEEEPEMQRALDRQQQARFLKTAASNPRWHSIWWYALAALHLTFSSDEMRTLRIGDINVAHQLVGVNPAFGKNFARRRTVTVEDGACMWALQKLMERAEQLCASWKDYRGPQPHHFLFPLRVVKNLYNPELPMGETGLRKPFDETRAQADLRFFQFNSFRHTGLTRLAEAGVPPYIMEKRAGHIGSKMMRRYVQIGEQAQRLAMQAAFAKKPSGSVAAPWEQTQMRVDS